MCQGTKKKIISASRRTDLVAFFPEWLAEAVRTEKSKVFGPSGHTYTVDLSPQNVHTFVLWSKNFVNLIDNYSGLRDEEGVHVSKSTVLIPENKVWFIDYLKQSNVPFEEKKIWLE